MIDSILDKIHKILSYQNWSNIKAIATTLAIIFGGVIFLLTDNNEKDKTPSNSKTEDCDKSSIYVKGSVSFDRDATKPKDISTLKIAFKGETEKCNHDITIEDDLSYFVKADKCEAGEKIKFSISNDGYKLGSNSVHSSTCKISPIRIY